MSWKGSAESCWIFYVKYFRAEGENPDLPQQSSGNMTKSEDDDDQYDDDHDEQSKLFFPERQVNKQGILSFLCTSKDRIV